MNNPMKPSMALLTKLGSYITHMEEGTSKTGHEFDIIAAKRILEDEEVAAWLDGMEGLALLPKRRHK